MIAIFFIKQYNFPMKKSEQEEYYKHLKALKTLKNTTDEEIVHNPNFILNNQQLTLDFLSSSDEKHLKKIFKIINKLLKSNSENIVENFSDFKQSIAEEIIAIQTKDYITVKEFAIKYNISKDSQQVYRGRLHDPLPYHQKVPRGKIVYVVKEVEQWFDNQHK